MSSKNIAFLDQALKQVKNLYEIGRIGNTWRSGAKPVFILGVGTASQLELRDSESRY